MAYTVYYIRYFGIAYSPVKLALNATKKRKKGRKVPEILLRELTKIMFRNKFNTLVSQDFLQRIDK